MKPAVRLLFASALCVGTSAAAQPGSLRWDEIWDRTGEGDLARV